MIARESRKYLTGKRLAAFRAEVLAERKKPPAGQRELLASPDTGPKLAASGWTMRIAALVVMATCAIGTAGPTTEDTAETIASTERRLPWFWSSMTEGLTDIPYTYEMLMTRRVIVRGRDLAPKSGSVLGNWRTLRLERIPLEFGSFMRCLSESGKSPCSDEWNQELERQGKKRDALTAEDRARIEATREQRRERRRGFWDDFPAALRFESSGRDELRFSPRPGYKPQRSVHDGMLTAISGSLHFDASTGEITRMEYDLVRDVDEPFLRYLKGAHFEIVLMQADQHYVPQRIRDRYRVPKSDRVEDRVTEFSNFRRFDTESKIDFGDPKEVKK
jgi:hypothetical protein